MRHIPTLILSALAMMFATTAWAEGDNLIKNGGFEEWDSVEKVWPAGRGASYGCSKRAPQLESNLAPKGWWVMENYLDATPPEDHCRLVKDDLIKYEGDFSVRLEVPAPQFSCGVGMNAFRIEPGGKNYTIRGYVRGDDINLTKHLKAYPHLMVIVSFGTGSFWDNKVDKVLPLTAQRGTFDWTPFEVSIRAPENADLVMLQFQLCTASGKAWLDGIEMHASDTP